VIRDPVAGSILVIDVGSIRREFSILKKSTISRNLFLSNIISYISISYSKLKSSYIYKINSVNGRSGST